jgi:hypothetical protein
MNDMNYQHLAHIPTHDNTTGEDIPGVYSTIPSALSLYITLKLGGAKPGGGICTFFLFNINRRSMWFAKICIRKGAVEDDLLKKKEGRLFVLTLISFFFAFNVER